MEKTKYGSRWTFQEVEALKFLLNAQPTDGMTFLKAFHELSGSKRTPVAILEKMRSFNEFAMLSQEFKSDLLKIGRMENRIYWETILRLEKALGKDCPEFISTIKDSVHVY